MMVVTDERATRTVTAFVCLQILTDRVKKLVAAHSHTNTALPWMSLVFSRSRRRKSE